MRIALVAWMGWARQIPAPPYQMRGKPGSERQAADENDHDAREVARVPDVGIRPARDHVLAAVGLNAHDRGEEPVDGHRPEAQHVSGRRRDQAEGLYP